MILIGLNGRAGAGKDTVCNFIKEWGAQHDYTVRRDAFADRLKLSAARIFFPDIGVEKGVAWCNAMKSHGTLMFALPEGERALGTESGAITGRRFLQRYGTEAHREVFGTDFWVDALTSVLDESVGITVITDVRFENEAHAIRRQGGEVWEILRRDATIAESAHVSESPLPAGCVDGFIQNGRDLAALRQTVYKVLDHKFAKAVA